MCEVSPERIVQVYEDLHEQLSATPRAVSVRDVVGEITLHGQTFQVQVIISREDFDWIDGEDVLPEGWEPASRP